MRSRLAKIAVSTGLLLILSLLVIACGGNGDATPTGSAGSAAPAQSQPSAASQATTAAPSQDATAPSAPASDEPFRIGVMESLTGPGETYGNVALQAKQLAADEINAAGGINGRMLELIAEDSKCSAQDAITAYNKLTDVDGVKIILGTSCSGAMLGAAPLAESRRRDSLLGSGHQPGYRRRRRLHLPHLDERPASWASTPATCGPTGTARLATITETTDYAEGVRRTTAEHFVSLGWRDCGCEERYASDVTDFRSQITKLIGANPDAIHMAAQSEFSGGTIVKQIRELGYDGPHLLRDRARGRRPLWKWPATPPPA